MILRRIFIVGSIFCSFWVQIPVKSQIVLDNTTNTSITNNCPSVCEITGGTVAGDNLFHSFDRFNIGIAESAYFVDPGVTNILGRVTGNNPSNIQGILGVSGGDANLWLLNPNGIIFGAGAALDLNGSFLATTADEVQFGNDVSFSAIPNAQENLALLNINPSALFFNQMGQNQPISVNSGTILQVPNGESLALAGGQPAEDLPGVNLEFGGLFAFEGDVIVGAIADSGAIGINDDLHLSFPNNVNKGDISLSGGSGINVSGVGGGNVSLQGDNISLSGASNIFSSTTGDRDGGQIDISTNNLTISENSTISTNSLNSGKSSDINITASESINLVGSSINTLQQLLSGFVSENSSPNLDNTSINTVALADGASGNIKIKSQNLNLDNGSWILATTDNIGHAGNIEIDLSDTVVLNSSGILTGTGLNSTGNAGTLNINSDSLLLENSGIISSSTAGEGKGGDLTLNVANSILLRQTLFDGLVPTGIFTNTVVGNGTAGNLTVNTSQLTMTDGSVLSSGSGTRTNLGVVPFGGQGGNITVNATEYIEIAGISANNLFPSGIVNSTFSNNPAGNIEIHTGRLDLQGEAIISASSIGTGAGGNLTINADESINLRGISFTDLENFFVNGLAGDIQIQNITGGLLTNTQTIGKAGNTKITTPSLTLENGALISTSTFGGAAGGNIDIVAQDVTVSSSVLASSAVGEGPAGNITIETDRLTTRDNGLITASSTGAGNAGNLKVDATEFVKLIDTNKSSLVLGGLTTTSLGLSYSGNLSVNTKDLTIAGGAKISANNSTEHQINRDAFTIIDLAIEQFNVSFSKGIIINAESINISGTSANQLFNSSISSATTSIFPASNIEINTSKLTIADRAEISVSSFGEGKAGNLKISADSIDLESQGGLNATTLSGRGGNIELRVNDILSLNEAQIRTDASKMGNGGNVYIDTNFAIASRNSNISATAEQGNGGNIQIDATDLFITPSSTISASSELGGIDGKISIKTFDTSDRHSLIKLPTKTIRADNLIVKSCGNGNGKSGVFSYTGKGGLPPSLLSENYLGDRHTLVDLGIPHRSQKSTRLETSNFKLTPLTPTIVEAATWKINHRDRIELVAKADNDPIFNPISSSGCPF